MMFDDRLATVLGSPVGGETAARTQYRQLVDLLGTPGRRTDGPLEARAWNRLAELGEIIPAEDRSAILRDPGLRLRDARLVGVLAAGDTRPAAAAMAVARLDEAEWRALIPTLPVMARGFLRHRRDLPAGTRELLRQLGAGDMLLPQPESPPPPQAPSAQVQDRDSIRTLLRRIEAFREGRRADAAPGPTDPRLPLGDVTEDENLAPPPAQFAFTADEAGRIGWTEEAVAPLLCGLRLGPAGPGAVAALDDRAMRAVHRRQPLRGGALAINAAPAISGDWRVDAEPVFAPGGAFTGWRGRLRRPVFTPGAETVQVPVAVDTPQDRMRQVLHELRTPVNAIQGFAEIIQQQLFGPAPNEYRAHAAAIAVDAAKLLAGFDEIDRLSKLEAGAVELEPGEADLRAVTELTIRRMEGVLRSRGAGFSVHAEDAQLPTPLAHSELLVLVWRVLASLAGALAPSEVLGAELSVQDRLATLAVDLPGTIARAEDPFTLPLAEQRPVLSAGMFGPGFAFRLARAEAEAVGGSLDFTADTVTLRLPLLTGC